MNTMLMEAQTLTRARTLLDEFPPRIAELFAKRANILDDACTALSALGLEASLQHGGVSSRVVTGDVVVVTESFERWRRGMVHRRECIIPGSWRTPASLQPENWWTGDGRLFVARGLHKVLFVDGKDVLLAAMADNDPEVGRRRSIGRLRNVARKDDLRVRVRDLDVALIDPMGNTVHQGDVGSCFAFLLNLDLDEAEEW